MIGRGVNLVQAVGSVDLLGLVIKQAQPHLDHEHVVESSVERVVAHAAIVDGVEQVGGEEGPAVVV